tara:strand:+ start:2100 stop:2954 length:855 start_codon:yes stop_codon:yes gene_type:complete
MFDKKLLLQHIENRPRTIEEQNSSGSGVRSRDYKDWSAQDWMDYDDEQAATKKAKEDLQQKGLEDVVRSDAYRDASDEERDKLLDDAMNLRGVAGATRGTQTDPNVDMATFRAISQQRGENVMADTRAELAQMSPEEKERSFQDAMDRTTQSREADYARGRDAFFSADGPQSMADVDAMRRYFKSNRRDYGDATRDLFSQAQRDLTSAEKDPVFGPPKTNTDLRRRMEFVMQDQGVDINDPDALKAETERRKILADKTTAALDALRRRRTGFGSPTTAGSSGRF